jgi:hypothetical protein
MREWREREREREGGKGREGEEDRKRWHRESTIKSNR